MKLYNAMMLTQVTYSGKTLPFFLYQNSRNPFIALVEWTSFPENLYAATSPKIYRPYIQYILVIR